MKKLWPLYALIFSAVAVLSWAVVSPASSHEWFTGTTNIKGGSCCGGADCKNIPFDAVREVEGGFLVTLTKDEMLRIRRSLGETFSGPYGSGGPNKAFAALTYGIIEFVPAAEAQNAADGNYSVCLHGYPVKTSTDLPDRWINCFFIPSNS